MAPHCCSVVILESPPCFLHDMRRRKCLLVTRKNKWNAHSSFFSEDWKICPHCAVSMADSHQGGLARVLGPFTDLLPDPEFIRVK